MGDPKKQRKKYETPRFPWQADTLNKEFSMIGQYGLRNKRELWRYNTLLSNFRGIARSLLGKSGEERVVLENQLLGRLNRLGILSETGMLDDVLDLSIEDLLERRLQTQVFRRGLSKSIYQSRQFITHGHIAIGRKRIYSPSYLVLKNEEADIAYAPTSCLSDPNHSIRQSMAAPATKMKPVRKTDEEE
jgi:small subunit ribosomal protein S4